MRSQRWTDSILTAMATLPMQQRQVVSLMYFKDKSIAEIATTLRLSESEVEVLRGEALVFMFSKVKAGGIDDDVLEIISHLLLFTLPALKRQPPGTGGVAFEKYRRSVWELINYMSSTVGGGRGVLVNKVVSPDACDFFHPNDIIVKYDRHPIDDVPNLAMAARSAEGKSTVQVVFIRLTKVLEANLPGGTICVETERLADILEYRLLAGGKRGVVVKRVMSQTTANLLAVNDIIIRYNGQLVDDSNKLIALTASTTGQPTVDVVFVRKGKQLTGRLAGGKMGVQIGDVNTGR
jgi:hypothetical protein